jgi:threonine dehydrogenase-like Zn-dependent dehydrogenase
LEQVKIVFTAPWTVEVQREAFSREPLTGRRLLVQKLYTLISPGTELACLSGNESWFPMPSVPGYAAVSRIIDKGPLVDEFEMGETIFHYGNHSRYETISPEGVVLPVPDGLEPLWAPFARMATVAMTSLRVSQIELGDFVAVTGLGLIGNMAAQLAGLQGAEVIGVDLVPQRLQIADQCGIRHTLSGDSDVRGQIMELTGKQGVSTWIEATGVPGVVLEGLPWMAKYGEVILLGSPRGELQTDITRLLNYIHLDGLGSITVKGAHEWRYPVKPDPFVKHSLTRNTAIAFSLMLEGKLQIAPLISRKLSPDEAPSAYEGLLNRKDDYLGIVFEW